MCVCVYMYTYIGFKNIHLLIYLAAPGLRCSMWIQLPGQESNLSPLHWKCGVLVTGSPGKFNTNLMFHQCLHFDLPSLCDHET